MKHKMWSRLLSMALAVMMIASIVPNSAFAEAASEIVASSQAVAEVVEGTEEVTQPEETTGEEPAEQPAGETASDEEPVAEPTAEPVTESEQPTAEPSQAPAETAVPSEQPSAEPSAAPEGTQTPEGTEAPEGTAVPSETPAASATPAPSESPVPSETPAATEEPEQGMSALTGEELVAALMQLDDEALVAALDTLTEEQIASVDALEAAKTEALFARLEVLFGAPETDVQEPLDFNAMSVEELDRYLMGMSAEERSNVLENLSDEQSEAYRQYRKTLAFGENPVVEEGVWYAGGAAVGMTSVAGLIYGQSASMYPMMRMAAYGSAETQLVDAAQNPSNGLVMKKSIAETAQKDEYKITLETYATGDVTQSGGEKIPSDIILVLDQSGSMAKTMQQNTYEDTKFQESYTNDNLFEEYKDNVFVKTEDGTHYPVTVEQKLASTSVEWQETTKQAEQWRYTNFRRNAYYYLDNEEYIRVIEMDYGWNWDEYEYEYYLQLENGKTVTLSGNDHVTLYQEREVKKYSYTYSYTYNDELKTVTRNEDQTTIPTVTNSPDFFAEGMDGLYYSKVVSQSEIYRLNALKNAAIAFANSVKEDAATSETDHRVAVVGFSSDDYDNTEILTVPQLTTEWHYEYQGYGTMYYYPNSTAYKGIQYSTSWGSEYQSNNPNYRQDALKNVNTDYSNINTALNALNAHGGTQTNDGLQMAKDIFSEQDSAYQAAYANGERNRVVILFTDGEPTGEGSTWSNSTANDAVKIAAQLKQMPNTTVYTIGIFDNADPSGTDRANNFMNYMSSNYTYNGWGDASMNDPGQKTGDGYYLTAKTADELEEIFQKISDSIETPSTTVELDESTQIIDEMSEYFTLPEEYEGEIKVYKVPYIGTVDGVGQFDESKRQDITDQMTVDVTAGENGKGRATISGFDFKNNYIYQLSNGTVGGYKLEIEIPVKYDSAASFGGNNIPSNDVGSGIYYEGSCYGTFDVPHINHEINYQIDAQDQTIYLTQSADLTKLMTYTTGYQPDGVKNRFVTITYTLMQKDTKIATLQIPAEISVTDANAPKWVAPDGQILSPSDLTDCKPYTISCTVSPSETAEVGSIGVPAQTPDQPYQAASTVHVLKPVITWKDTTRQYQAVVDPSTENLVTVDWKDSTAESVQGTTADVAFGVQVPKLSYEFSLVDGKEWPKENKITEEMQVKVTVKIGNGDVTQYTTFKWQKDAECPESCTDPNENNPEFQFRIHLGSGKLIITKMLTKLANNGSPVFDFKVTAEDGTVYYYHVDMTDKTLGDTKQVVEVTLPAGKYTVEELDNQNYDLAAVTGAISQNNGQVTIGGEPKTVNFTNEGKDTNIPTDNSGVVNELVKDENGKYTMSFQKKEELGQTTGSTTSN